MTHVLAGNPCSALYNNLEVDNGGLAVLLLYLDMLQEAKGANAARHSVGEAFELTLRDEIAAYKSYMEALEQVLRTRPLVFIRPRLLVRALACWSGQIANQQTSKLALQGHSHTGCDIAGVTLTRQFIRSQTERFPNLYFLYRWRRRICLSRGCLRLLWSAGALW